MNPQKDSPKAIAPRPLEMDPRSWAEELRSGDLDAVLDPIYGSRQVVRERASAMIRVTETFGREFGEDREVFLVRAPCRINLMGMHVEHRGGFVNYITHAREVLLAAAPNDGDAVNMADVRSEAFPRRHFTIGEEMARGDASDWVSYIESPGVVAAVKGNQGDWCNYVKAAILRLQAHFAPLDLCGLDMAFLGNIPHSSGLSSSSAMVVVSSLAALQGNGLQMDRGRLAEICGEGEWYVGTRGGAGDHAAMLFCRRDRICHLRFFPFEVDRYLAIPEGYSIVIANSLKSAHKAGAVLDAYNQTIAAYNMVLMLIKEAMDELGFGTDLIEGTQHLRDINPGRLPLPDVYRILAALPERASRRNLIERFPRRRRELDRIFSTHREPADGYRIRAVALFGIAECERGRIFADLLETRQIDAAGRLMFTEHDGDRVIHRDPGTGSWMPWDNEVSDGKMEHLIADSSSGDPARVGRSMLHLQPGGYGCSSEELDMMVEIARSVPGVLGAGLTGAGFGGCIRILVRQSSVAGLLEALGQEYYDPRGLPRSAERVQTVSRACVLGSV